MKGMSIRMKYLTKSDTRLIGSLAQSFADRVDEALAVKGMTQKKLGERAGITNPSYQSSWWSNMRRQIEEGRFNPSMGMVLRFARALKTKPDELLEPMK